MAEAKPNDLMAALQAMMEKFNKDAEAREN
jgi:hypothetical protein